MSGRYAVIMAGGKGERFWPLSTSKQPKQLLALVGEKPLIAQAVDRLEGLVPVENVFIVTNADLVEATRAAVPQLPPQNIVGEPFGRDTAAAVACAGALVRARDPEAVFAILTADQVIGDPALFSATLRDAMTLAAQHDILVTIGIQPTFPSTGYGYIEAGDLFEEPAQKGFRRAARFVEKPDLATAEAYIASGQFYWNSGMFIWSVPSLARAFAAHCPVMHELMDALTTYASRNALAEGMEKLYPALEKISIDYALMEKADNIVMACGTFSWDDVGSWPALEKYFGQDADGNTRIGQVEAVGSARNIVLSNGHLTALVGVEDLIVVQTEGVTLVCAKERAQEIKQLVTKLREAGGYDALL